MYTDIRLSPELVTSVLFVHAFINVFINIYDLCILYIETKGTKTEICQKE